MPILDSININPADLQEILEQVAAKKYTGIIKILDCIYSWTVRDSDGLLLTDVKKTAR